MRGIIVFSLEILIISYILFLEKITLWRLNMISKNAKNSKKFIFMVVLSLLFSLLTVNSTVMANSNSTTKMKKAETSAQVSKNAVQKEKNKATQMNDNLDQSAIKAVSETYKVVELLDKKKDKEALDLLKKVIGELEVILTAHENISLLPIDSYTVVIDSPMKPEDIKSTIKEVKKLLDKGDVQAAKILLDTLQSEIDIVINNLPLGTYPDAMKLASKYIIDKKYKQAKEVLTVALNSMVEKNIIIPLPIVRAYALVDAASKQATTNKDKALNYIDEAKNQLEIAKLLGYGNDDSKIYEDLQKSLDKIQKEVKGKNKAEKMFEDFLKKLKDFKKKLIS